VPRLAAAVAGRALLRLRSRLGATAVARRAFIERGNANLGFGATRGVFERELEVVAQVGAAKNTVAATPALRAENFTEDIAKRVGEAAKAFRAAAKSTRSGKARRCVDARVAGVARGGGTSRT